jgi:hypothetical protein
MERQRGLYIFLLLPIMLNNNDYLLKYSLSEYCHDPICPNAVKSDSTKSDKIRVVTSKVSRITREETKKSG